MATRTCLWVDVIVIAACLHVPDRCVNAVVYTYQGHTSLIWKLPKKNGNYGKFLQKPSSVKVREKNGFEKRKNLNFHLFSKKLWLPQVVVRVSWLEANFAHVFCQGRIQCRMKSWAATKLQVGSTGRLDPGSSTCTTLDARRCVSVVYFWLYCDTNVVQWVHFLTTCNRETSTD